MPCLIPLRSSIQPNLKSIILTSIKICPERLLNSLELCRNLETLILSKVDLTSSFGDTRTVNLPRLKTFSLEVGLNTEIGDYNRKEVFSSWIPFLTEEDVDKMSQLNINLELIGPDDGLILKLNHEEGEFISKLKWTNDILENMNWDELKLKKLVIFFCRASIHIKNFPSTLTHLEMTEVKINNGKLSDIFSKCIQIEYLYLNTIRDDDEGVDESQLNLLDLHQCHNLKALWLINDMKITGYTSSTIQLSNVAELILDWRVENFDENIVENLQLIFPNLRVAVLVMHNRLVNSLLEKVVQLKSIEKILFKTYYIKELKTDSIDSPLNQLLKEINPDEVELFYLEKEVKNCQWTGKPVESGNYGPFLRGLLKSPFVALF